MKCLIVDDDPSIRRLVALALRRWNLEMMEAGTAAEAISSAHAFRPDLILLDVVLPDGDGRDVLRALRSDQSTFHIPVVFLTALSDPHDRIELLAGGAEDVVAKPLDMGKLPHQIGRFLGVPSAGTGVAGFAELQREFLRGCDARLRSIDRAIDLLEANPAETDALRELRRHLHSFVGTAGSLGFAKVAALARLGETECERNLRERVEPSEGDLDRWRGLAATLQHELIAGNLTRSHGSALESPVSGSRSQSVLLVGEDRDMMEVGKRVLHNAGYDVETATSREAALAVLAEAIPEALVVDTVLPDGPGQELIDELRALVGGDASTVIVVSSTAGFLDKVETLGSGADGIFDKPVDWQAVARRLQHLLHESISETSRVLYVEDDPDQAAYVQSVLESAGYQVRICANPRHFDADLIAFAPDLILMDVLLPSLSGYDLVRYLRLNEAYATLPVLFLTTEAALHAQISSARAGGDDHLIKPVPPPLLIAQVSTRIERARFIRSLINRDGLTGLLTHSAFIESATVALAQTSRDPDSRVVLIMIDIDGFKSINDRFGHPTGDRALTTLAAFLRRRIRQSDVLGRYGGDEFAAILHNIEEEGAVRLMSRVAREFAAHELQAADGTRFHATISAGVAELGSPGNSLDVWREAADNALYGAKAAGRNCVVGASQLNDLLAELIDRSS